MPGGGVDSGPDENPDAGPDLQPNIIPDSSGGGGGQQTERALLLLIEPGGTSFGEIRRQVQQLLVETEGTEGAFAPFLLDQLIIDITDEVCSVTDCLYGILTSDITAGKARYCCPPFTKIKVSQIKTARGTFEQLAITNPRKAGKLLPTGWENETADPPRVAMIGTPKGGMRLHPVPSVSRVAAVHLEGFYVPGKTWEYADDGTPLPLSDDSICPLPEWAVQAVKYGVAALRAVQFPTKENLARLPFYEKRYRNLRGDVEAQAATFYHDSRSGRIR